MELLDIKGVGAITLSKLEKLNIKTPEDIIHFLPKTYWDMSSVSVLSDTLAGDYVLLEGKISYISKTSRFNGMQFFKCDLSCQGQVIGLIWYNAAYLRNNLIEDNDFFVWGKFYLKKGKKVIYNPSFELSCNRKRLQGITPIYPLKNCIGKALYSNIVKQCLSNFKIEGLLDESQSTTLNNAYVMAHCPTCIMDIEVARARINKENLVVQILAHRFARYNFEFVKSTSYGQSGCVTKDLQKSLPYELTFSQQQSLDAIIADMQSCQPMNRMLLGDVGSGKTIVAMLSLYYAVVNGHQGAMLAPTAILAKQHYLLAQKLFKNFNISICMLLGDTPQKDREILKKNIKTHTIDIVFGTHALLSDDIIFDDLSYIVVDELHKFGVKQKGILLNKSRSVDSLIMSATPIPRVIALSVYGDIALSEVVTRKSASNVKTYIVNDNKLDGLYGFIAERVLLGEQAYIVCPLVEDSDGLEIFSAKTAYSELSKSYPKIRFALTHGKQNDKQKQEIMQAFMSGDIDVLVATSVVEVGIDCQNASVMAVLNSDRFGLASLHQLRGRVGRDPSKQGFCFLHTSLQKENQRLKVLQNFDDGKLIAEEDAKLRGYGDFLGISQSGGNNNLLLTKDFVAECNALADGLMLTRGQSLQQKPIIKEYIDSLRNIEMM